MIHKVVDWQCPECNEKLYKDLNDSPVSCTGCGGQSLKKGHEWNIEPKEIVKRKLEVITQCERSQINEDQYWHPFRKGEIVTVIMERKQDISDRYILCSNGKDQSYLSEYDVKEINN